MLLIRSDHLKVSMALKLDWIRIGSDMPSLQTLLDDLQGLFTIARLYACPSEEWMIQSQNTQLSGTASHNAYRMGISNVSVLVGTAKGELC